MKSLIVFAIGMIVVTVFSCAAISSEISRMEEKETEEDV